MKKLIITTAAIMLFASSSAYAVDEGPDQKNNMMQSSMMKNCPMMKNGEMKTGMPKGMMAHCQKTCRDMMSRDKVMQNGMMMKKCRSMMNHAAHHPTPGRAKP